MTSLIKRKATPGTAPERLPVTPSVIKNCSPLEPVMDLEACLIHPLLDEYLPQTVSV